MNNGKAWWVTVIEGVIAIILGLYLLLGGDNAANNVFLVAALYLLLTGVISLFRGTIGSIARYQAIIAIVVGAAYLLLYALNMLGNWGYNLVAIGAIIVGALGLYSAFFARSGQGFSWGPVLANGLLLLLGIMIFVSDSLQLWTAVIFIVIGVVLALWGFFSRDDEEEEVTSENIQEKIEDAQEEIEEAVEDATDEASE